MIVSESTSLEDTVQRNSLTVVDAKHRIDLLVCDDRERIVNPVIWGYSGCSSATIVPFVAGRWSEAKTNANVDRQGAWKAGLPINDNDRRRISRDGAALIQLS